MGTRRWQLRAEARASLDTAALARLNHGDVARRVCAMARDILGGNGILLDHHVALHHADIEAVYTYEGTDSVQSLIVGRADDVIIAETTVIMGAFDGRQILLLQPVASSRRRAVIEFLVENQGNSQANCRLPRIDTSQPLDGP